MTNSIQQVDRPLGKKPKKNWFSKVVKFFTSIFAMVTTVVMACAVAGAAFFTYNVSNAEIPDKPSQLFDKSAVRVLASDGVTELAKLYPQEGIRKIVPSDLIPDDVKNALVSAENSRFWEDPGFDIVRIARAAYKHLENDPDAGGASTITQQLVKNTLVGDEYSTDRKLKEIYSSAKLSSAWSKDEVISAYLNTVYYGRGAIGIEMAARAYFDIPAEQLNLAQSAFLAGVVQSPSTHDPAVNQQSAGERFTYVIEQMKKNGYIDENEVVDFPATIYPKPLNESTGIFGENGHIVSMAYAELEKKGFSKEQLFTMGADIVTTIDPHAQDVVVSNAKGAAEYNGIRTAAVATDPHTGAIRGIYAGSDGQGLNYATTPQMTGSTFKVFALAAALENGIGLDTRISSAPYESNGVVLNNSGGMTCGECSLAEATKQSLNTSFYRVQDMLPDGPMTTREMARRLGVDTPLEDEGGYVAKSIVLGSYLTSMAGMSDAMATIANNGTKNDQHIVERVITRHNNLVYKTNPNPRRVLDPAVAAGIDTALQPIPAYSNGNQLSGKTGYGKTGTVQLGDTGLNRDALMVGYTDNMALAVWAGTDDGSPLYNAGGGMIWGAGVPATTWKNILNEIG